MVTDEEYLESRGWRPTDPAYAKQHPSETIVWFDPLASPRDANGSDDGFPIGVARAIQRARDAAEDWQAWPALLNAAAQILGGAGRWELMAISPRCEHTRMVAQELLEEMHRRFGRDP